MHKNREKLLNILTSPLQRDDIPPTNGANVWSCLATHNGSVRNFVGGTVHDLVKK